MSCCQRISCATSVLDPVALYGDSLLMLRLPRTLPGLPSQKEVAKRLHVIRLSAKIVKVLVTASTLGLSVGNLVPALSFEEEDTLLEAVSSHLASVEEQAYV